MCANFFDYIITLFVCFFKSFKGSFHQKSAKRKIFLQKGRFARGVWRLGMGWLCAVGVVWGVVVVAVGGEAADMAAVG